MDKAKEKVILYCKHDENYMCESEERQCVTCFRYSPEYLKSRGKVVKEKEVVDE